MIPYLQFTSLNKHYGAVTALSDVNLTVERGSVVALLGPNGAGKSTLFGCLLGLARPTAGRITLLGESVTDADRAWFGYVSERVAVYPQRTVLENAQFFAQLRGVAGDVRKQLERVGLGSAQNRKAGQLSKGMLQRLGLAIALCGQPELLVLDEPFNGLDPALLDDLREILRAENNRGATLLISTHTMSAIEPLATHVAVLLQGKLAAHGTLEELRAAHDGEISLEKIYHRIARRRRETIAQEVCA